MMRRFNRFDVAALACLSIVYAAMFHFGVPVWAVVLIAVVFGFAHWLADEAKALRMRDTIAAFERYEEQQRRKRAGAVGSMLVSKLESERHRP